MDEDWPAAEMLDPDTEAFITEAFIKAAERMLKAIEGWRDPLPPNWEYGFARGYLDG